MRHAALGAAIALAAGMLLAACGGGGGGDDTASRPVTSDPPPPVPEPDASAGSETGAQQPPSPGDPQGPGDPPMTGSGGWRVDAAEARSLTGGALPAHSASETGAHFRSLVGKPGHAHGLNTWFKEGEIQPVMTRNGVNVFQIRQKPDAAGKYRFNGYGVWLSDTWYIAGVDSVNPTALASAADWGVAIRTQAGLLVGARWSGVMVARNEDALPADPTFVQGDADLRVTSVPSFQDPRFTLRFSNIVDVVTGQGRADIEWADLRTSGASGVVSHGTYRPINRPDRDNVRVQFAGVAAAQALGSFQKGALEGGFVAKRAP